MAHHGSLDALVSDGIESVQEVLAQQLAAPYVANVSSSRLAEWRPSLLYGTADGATDAGSADAVTELPAPPDAGLLTLTGLLTLAGAQLGRSARRMQFGGLPDWYHAACPGQIGHRLVFDLNDHAPIERLPAVVFAWPPVALQTTSQYGPHDATAPPLRPQCVLRLAAPRGPPSCAES
ncbi:MAG TPA: hypothetical protein PLQ89_19465 [Phycisphaerae bacterium]|nr:hypothetical protein [Phycisphaerae bacterium]